MRPQRPSGLPRSVLLRVLVLIVLLSGGIFVPWVLYAQSDPIFLPIIQTEEEPAGASEPTLPPAATITATATLTTTPMITTTATITATTTPTPTATPAPTIILPPPAYGYEWGNIVGSVFVNPRFRVIEEGEVTPTEYVVLLDTSGSMNWNFAGQAGSSSNPGQCTFNPATPDVQIVKCGGKKWNTTEERRIYIAKQAIMRLIDTLEPYDAMQIVGFSSRDYDTEPSGPRQFGTDEGKAALKQAVLDAGRRKDPYSVSGGTTTPRALLKARELFASAPVTAPSGEEYQRVLLLLTDGVANHFDQRYDVPWGDDEWLNRATDDPVCAEDPNVGENVACQTGYVNNDIGGIMRPIISMIYHGEQVQDDDVDVYAMMLGAADTTGLDRVASQPAFPWYSTVRDAGDLDNTLAAIVDRIVVRVDDTCVPQVKGWVDRIEPEHESAEGPPFGHVVVHDANNVEQARVPIMHNETTGQLSYEIDSLFPGTYRIKWAWIDYVGEDGVERQYSRMQERDSYATLTEIVFEVPRLTPYETFAGPSIYLGLDGSVCPGPVE